MKMIKGGTVVQFRQQVNLLLFLVIAFALNGCATTKAVVYVKEAEQVTTQALEPVMLESEELRNDISTKFSSYLPSADTADDLMKIIQTELANTKRFTKVLLNASEGDTYILQPRIDKIEGALRDIPTDPTRKRFSVKARVRLDVLFYNQKNQKELVKSFYDERSYDERISAKEIMTSDRKQDYYRKTIDIAFRAAADQLGSGFNPSYEMGVVSKLSGKIAYVQINTSKIRKMPKKQQIVEVVDGNSNVLATIAELTIEDGMLSGRIYEKSGASIKEGQKVRARVNALSE